MIDFLSEEEKKNNYDSHSIEVLEGLEPIRLRPGMYIGGTDKIALHHLVLEILDNSMDEVISGFATEIHVTLNEEENMVTISDNGRGIPFAKHAKFEGRSALEIILTTLHSGGKFNDSSYQTSGGLHGVGLAVVNALSKFMSIEVIRENEMAKQEYSRGIPKTEVLIEKINEKNKLKNGTKISFIPDEEIFEDNKFDKNFLYEMIKAKSYLIKGIKIVWKFFNSKNKGSNEAETEFKNSETFLFKNGIYDYLEKKLNKNLITNEELLNENSKIINKEKNHLTKLELFKENEEKKFTQNKEQNDYVIFHGNAQIKKESKERIEWAVAFFLNEENEEYENFGLSFCNTIKTELGGSHETAFKSGLIKAFKSCGERLNNKKISLITGDDIEKNSRRIISCFVNQPQFQGQTKDKLTSQNISKPIENVIFDYTENWLVRQPTVAEKIFNAIIYSAEKRIKGRQKNETNKLSGIKRLRLPGKLSDCLSNDPSDSELFLVEGDSAGGSAKQARDRFTQAVLPLRGKILNVATASTDKFSKNKELDDISVALGVSKNNFKIENLRYHKLIIMTDADVDGAHITSLLLTFFITELPLLVSFGHIYIAKPPLYRLTSSKKNTIYAANDEEKEAILKNKKKGETFEISRFKGLGEMPVKQLKNTTMDKETRVLIKVTVESINDVQNFVSQIMGKNSEYRFNFIQKNAKFIKNIDI